MSESGPLSLASPPACGGVLVALSGGSDSVALAAALAAREDCRPLHLAWLRHGFRRHDPDEDATVRAVARALAVPLHVLDDCPLARPRAGAIPEAWARARRYARLAALANDLGLRVLATAHHREDQHETRLLNLLRGGGLRAVAGMRSVRVQAGVSLWRPLLESPRTELDAMRRERGLPCFADATNRDLRQRRNLLRHRVIPQLERQQDPLHARLPTLGRLAERAVARIEASAQLWLSDRRLPTARPGAGLWPLRPWLGCSPTLRHHLLEIAMRDLGGVSSPLNGTASRRFADWLTSGGQGELLILGCCWQRSGPWLALRAPGTLRAADSMEPAAVQPARSDRDGTPVPVVGRWRVRCRHPGDRLRLQDRGSRKLKRLLLEAGVIRMERDAWPIVEDEAGIAWVPQVGVREAVPGSVTLRLHAPSLPDLIQRRSILAAIEPAT